MTLKSAADKLFLDFRGIIRGKNYDFQNQNQHILLICPSSTLKIAIIYHQCAIFLKI